MTDNPSHSFPPDLPGDRAATVPPPTSDFGPAAGAATLPPVAPAATPTGHAPVSVPGYEILKEIGRGGMGVVYQARQVKLNRTVALKMILSGGYASDADLARFRTEAEAVARLQHPNIVQVFDVGECEGRPFIALEFCAGGTLEERLAGTPLLPKEAARLVEALARAVEAAHRQHVLHRDLKPANVLLTPGGQPKVTDFGLAKKMDETGQTASGAVMGTPSYMAPEQAGGKVKELGPATDVYALGAILYECLTGRPPFKAATPLDTILQVVADEPVPPSRLQRHIAPDLETICLKCLAKNPDQRYSSAEALAADLHRFLGGEPIRARRPGIVAQTRAWLRRPERMRDAGLIQIWAALTAAAPALILFRLSKILSTHLAHYLQAGVHIATGILGVYIGLKVIARRHWAVWAGLVFSLFLVFRKLESFAFVPQDFRDLDSPVRVYFRVPHPSALLLSPLEPLLILISCVAIYAYYVNRADTRPGTSPDSSPEGDKAQEYRVTFASRVCVNCARAVDSPFCPYCNSPAVEPPVGGRNRTEVGGNA